VEALVAEAAVLRVGDVQPPQRAFVRAMVGDRLLRRIVVNSSSTSTQVPTGQAASAAATVCRRVLTEVSALAARWPLMCSTRLSSSISPRLTQARHSCRIVSAGATVSAVRPRAVSCSRLPASSASPPAWISSGQATAAIGSSG
jgi:hypothetical protein